MSETIFPIQSSGALCLADSRFEGEKCVGHHGFDVTQVTGPPAISRRLCGREAEPRRYVMTRIARLSHHPALPLLLLLVANAVFYALVASSFA